MTRRHARGLLAAVLAVAIVELVAAAFVYRDRIAADDWARVRDAVAALPTGQPVYVATPWIDPLARMEVPRIAELEHVARPDLRGAEVFSVVGFAGDRWGHTLQDDIEDQPTPRPVETRRFGALTLTTFEHRAPAQVVADPLPSGRFTVRTEDGACRPGDTWICGDGRVQWRLAEIDYRPRQCLAVDVPDGTVVQITVEDMPCGDALRGHLGFDDFNRRLRSDAPVTMTIAIDGEVAARWVVTDEQGWWPFVVDTVPGRHDVTVSLSIGARGTFAPSGYQDRAAHVPCLELRSLQEEAPA